MSSSARQNGKRVRQYAFACSSCKRRKIKCDGHKPVCTGCEKYREICDYAEAGRPMDGRAAKRSVARSQPEPSPRSARIPSPDQASSTNNRAIISVDPPRSSTITIHPSPSSRENAPVGPVARPRGIISDEAVTYPHSSPGGINGAAVGDLQQHVTRAVTGEIMHHGATSMLYADPLEGIVMHEIAQSPHDEDQLAQEGRVLRANQRLLRMWEALAFRELDMTGPDQETAWHLLETYWCWQHPQHLAIYRPAFLRDMGAKGPYFNDFLLNVVYAHAWRLAYPRGHVALATNGEIISEELLFAKAKTLLMVEMDRPTSVPTIQGLIILGGRQCAVGNPSAGFLYTGMACRMMKDLGIHLDGKGLAVAQNLSAEDKEIRRNMWWSAYVWDKHISLALGRGPSWTEYEANKPPYIIDHAMDDAMWTPHVASNQPAIGSIDYPPHQAYTVLTFNSLCQLTEIISALLLTLYVGEQDKMRRMTHRRALGQRLGLWRCQQPDAIKLDSSRLPTLCPPPHIFSLNMLYNATRILLNRPFMGDALQSEEPGATTVKQLAAEARSTCFSAAEEIHLLLELHGRTFEHKNMIYIVSYCVFLAASVNLVESRSRQPARAQAATERLVYATRILTQTTNKTPGLSKCVELLQQRQTRSLNPSRPSSQPPDDIWAWAQPAIGEGQSTDLPLDFELPGERATVDDTASLDFLLDLPIFPGVAGWYSHVASGQQGGSTIPPMMPLRPDALDNPFGLEPGASEPDPFTTIW